LFAYFLALMWFSSGAYLSLDFDFNLCSPIM
jgi:hypothetical protein